MKRLTPRIMDFGLTIGLAASLGLTTCSPESHPRVGGACETPKATATPSHAAEVGCLAIKLHLDPNQTVLDRLSPNDNHKDGKLYLHVLKVLQNDDGSCSDTAIKLTLPGGPIPIPADRDPAGNVDVGVSLPLENDATMCAAGYVAGVTGRTRAEYVGSFAVGQDGKWEFQPSAPDDHFLTVLTPSR